MYNLNNQEINIIAKVKHTNDVANEAIHIATAVQASVDTLKDTVILLLKNVHELRDKLLCSFTTTKKKN